MTDAPNLGSSFYIWVKPGDVDRTRQTYTALGYVVESLDTTHLQLWVHRPWPPAPPALAPGEKGIDVSHWNTVMDWGRVRLAGYRFAYIKRSQGLTGVDVKGTTHWADAHQAGLLIGAYHYFEWDQDGGQQAMHFLAVLGEVPGRLTPAIDVEPDGQPNQNIDQQVSTDNLRKLLAVMEEQGLRPPVIYTSKNAWARMTTEPPDLIVYPLWVADYSAPLDLPTGFPWARFQQIGQGAVDGVSGAVDLNVYRGVIPPTPPPVKHTLADLTNQAVINLFALAFGKSPSGQPQPYIEAIGRALTAAQQSILYGQRLAGYVGPAVEDMTLTDTEKAALIAAL